MKILYFSLVVFFLVGCKPTAKYAPSVSTNSKANDMNIYDFEMPGLMGDTIRFSDFKGKKIMIVNTASKCGLTPQYAQLEEFNKKFSDKVQIVGFPANNFMGQEPGKDEEIAQFCEVNYGVTFPMGSKISVKGKDMHSLYQWLTQKEKNGKLDSDVQWNFQKFLIDEKGELQAVFSPKMEVFHEEVVAATGVELK
jgi:glutathione peroxidase